MGKPGTCSAYLFLSNYSSVEQPGSGRHKQGLFSSLHFHILHHLPLAVPPAVLLAFVVLLQKGSQPSLSRVGNNEDGLLCTHEAFSAFCRFYYYQARNIVKKKTYSRRDSNPVIGWLLGYQQVSTIGATRCFANSSSESAHPQSGTFLSNLNGSLASVGHERS